MTIPSVITTKKNRKKQVPIYWWKDRQKWYIHIGVVKKEWSTNKYYNMNFKIMLREISHKGHIW